MIFATLSAMLISPKKYDGMKKYDINDEYDIYSSQKYDKMILLLEWTNMYIDHWKVHLMNLSDMEKIIFFDEENW